MTNKLMILPAEKPEEIRLIRIPGDFDDREVYRHVTGLVAMAEEDQDYRWEDLIDLLEERGFEPVDFILGPTLDL